MYWKLIFSESNGSPLAGILFHDIPLAARAGGSGNNFLEIEVPGADLAELARVIDRTDAILQMQQWQAPAELATPGRRVSAAELHPVSVDLCLQVLLIGSVINDVENRLVIELEKFEGVIVIGKHLARLAQDGSRRVQLPGEFPNGVQVSQIDVPGKRVSREGWTCVTA